jgi:hypothetical protein
MKKIILLTFIFLLSFAENTFSQEYHPLLNNSSWVINDAVSCCRPPQIRTIEPGTDIVIGSYTYKQFDDPFPQYDAVSQSFVDVVFLREDVAQKKVYKLVNGVDALLYDFNLGLGDVISQYGNTFTVTAVEDCAVNGGTRKKITLQSTEQYCGESLTQVWIEGVGTNKHPFYPEHNMYSVCSSGGGIRIYTKCSFQNGAHIFGNSECSAFIGLGTEEQQAMVQKISFSPNPFKTQLTIDSELQLQNASIKLFNSHGQLIRENNNLNGQKIVIDRQNLQSGLYFIQLFDQNKLVKTGKVIVD